MTDHQDSFEAIFGKPRSTDEAEDERNWNEKRNERSRLSFEAERDRRQAYVDMDHRIRSIAQQEGNKSFYILLIGGVTYGIHAQYGWIVAGLFLAFCVAYYLNEARKADNLPRKDIEECDNLAEDTVNHQRIVAFEKAGKPWFTLEGGEYDFDEIHAYPFWDDVNKQVREYVRMPPKDRRAHNRAAREASLPFRLAKQREIKEQNEEWDLPYFAYIDLVERLEK